MYRQILSRGFISLFMKETLAEYLRTLRLEKAIPLRKAAAGIDIDQSSLSKIERGDRMPTEDQLTKIAQYFGLNAKELWIRYKSDKVMYELLNEEQAEAILKVAEEKIQYHKSKQYQQGTLF